MLRELVALEQRLREEDKLPKPGLSHYAAPIKWTLTIFPGDPPEALLSPLGEDAGNKSRPDSGRTSGIKAYPLVDTAAYVLGQEQKEKGKPDKNAAVKHEAFRAVLDEVEAATEDPALSEAVRLVAHALNLGIPQALPEMEQVYADDWVQVQVETDALAGEPLYNHDDVYRYWTEWLDREVHKDGYTGVCAVSGEEGRLISRLPGKGYLRGKASLLGFNEDAYVSFVGGGSAFKKTSVGLSYAAADAANRALSYLAGKEQRRTHNFTLVNVRNAAGKEDTLASLTALFWIDLDEPVMADGQELKPVETGPVLLSAVDPNAWRQHEVLADSEAVDRLLSVPWKGKDSDLDLSDRDVYLAVVSKNVYRVVLRDWLPLKLGKVQCNLKRFREAARIVSPRGGRAYPAYIGTMLDALDAGKTDLARPLLYAAYNGRPVLNPQALLARAVARFRTLILKGLERPKADTEKARQKAEKDYDRALHALASLVKFLLTFGHLNEKALAMSLQRTDSNVESPPYHCGRLFAVLEKIQADAHDMDLNRSITPRYFGGVLVTPKQHLGELAGLAVAAHIPKLPASEAEAQAEMEERRKQAKQGEKVVPRWHREKANDRLQWIMKDLGLPGDWPSTLNADEKAELVMGYYHERARVRRLKSANRKSVNDQPRDPSNSNPSDDA